MKVNEVVFKTVLLDESNRQRVVFITAPDFGGNVNQIQDFIARKSEDCLGMFLDFIDWGYSAAEIQETAFSA